MIKYNVIKFCVILLLVAAFIFVPLWAGFIIISVSALVLTLLFMLILDMLSNLK
jgi:hypothetical protein